MHASPHALSPSPSSSGCVPSLQRACERSAWREQASEQASDEKACEQDGLLSSPSRVLPQVVTRSLSHIALLRPVQETVKQGRQPPLIAFRLLLKKVSISAAIGYEWSDPALTLNPKP